MSIRFDCRLFAFTPGADFIRRPIGGSTCLLSTEVKLEDKQCSCSVHSALHQLYKFMEGVYMSHIMIVHDMEYLV